MIEFLFLTLMYLDSRASLVLPAAYAEEAKVQKKTQYTCPMHPQIRTDHPGSCPICHMALVPIKETKAVETKPAVSGEKKIKFYRHPMDPSIHSKVPAKDSMGMDYIPVHEEDSNVQGEKLENRTAFSLTPEQFKLTGSSILKVESKNLVSELRLPGRALGGSRVAFQVFEQDLAQVKVGMSFIAIAPTSSNELRGTVTSIDSILDPMTRTARVIGSLSGGGELRPESSLIGILQVKFQNVVAVPENSVVHTGSKDLVFISDGNGKFTPRVVTLGPKAQGIYIIKNGVNNGDLISAGPNFLLDSESRIQFTYDSSNN